MHISHSGSPCHCSFIDGVGLGGGRDHHPRFVMLPLSPANTRARGDRWHGMNSVRFNGTQAMTLWGKLLVFMGDQPEKTPTPVFKKIFDLCNEGQMREPLRKEIYCQLLKQLNKNASRNSAARGWILLNMYVIRCTRHASPITCV